MKFAKFVAAGLLVSVSMVALPAAAAAPAAIVADPLAGLDVDVPAKKFVLKNGLTLIVHQDKSAPKVAVHIWYHVGSKNEPAGRSGFAHLFEHLMFNGSENLNDDFFVPTEKLGASDQNGTTSADRTNYYQTVPTSALDAMLWLESDRMGHLLGAIDQAKLDEQRAVVKNEKRQGENKPYAKAEDLVIRGTTSGEHPYGHSVIGSMDDLDAASIDDVKQWFRDYYGPSNAVLVLAGDITPEEGLAKVEKYFGAIEPGAPVAHLKSWPVKRTGTIREVTYDRVAEPMIQRVWNIADYASADTDYLQFLAQLLSGDRNARLDKRLVIDEEIATSVSAGVDNREIGGQFQIQAVLKPGGDIAAVERAIDEEVKKLLASGPTLAEMARFRTKHATDFVRGMESLSTKAAILAESQTYLGSPDAWKTGWSRYRDAKPSDIQRAGKAWLSDGDYVLHILPFGELAAASVDADRSKIPQMGAVAPAVFPMVERATLANGMEIVVAPRPGIPVVKMAMMLNTGIPADFAARPKGAGSFAVNMLTEGTKTRSAEALSDKMASIGANISAQNDGERSHIMLSAMKPTLRDALTIYADVIQNPAYPTVNVERDKAQVIAGLASEKLDGASAADRAFSALLHGKDTPYGRQTEEADIAALKPADLAAVHARWFKPNNATLVVSGDTSLAEIRPLVEAAFSAWRPGPVAEWIVPLSPSAKSSVVYLFDKPGATQSMVRAAAIAPKRGDGDEIARQMFNSVLGGGFTSRLNMKLREEKGWAYGASSGTDSARGSRVFEAAASVQTDKTAETMTEMTALLKDVFGSKPISADEFAKVKDAAILELSGAWSETDAVIGVLLDEASGEVPQDYYRTYAQKVAATDLAAVNAAGADLLKDKPLTWVIAGDLSKIEAPIRALGIGEVRVMDNDGNVLR